MGNKAEYRSAIRSRRLIREAFLQLLQEKDLQKITVTDVVNRADINRATFYAHYPDVRGVVEEIENEIISKMLDVLHEFQYSNFFQNPAPVLLKLNRYLEEDLDFYSTLIRANGAQLFLEKIKKIFISYMESDTDVPEHIRQSTPFSLRTVYFAGGIINLYQQWFSGELDCPLNDIAMEVSKILHMSAADLIDKTK